MGGLSVASLLSKAGKKVLVLEQHYMVGGYTHTFVRKGYEWDVGLHYVGQVHKEGSVLNNVFNYISDGNLKWAPLDHAYDRAVFGDKTYNFVAGRENWITQMKEYFPAPEDVEAIDKYVSLLDKVAELGNGYYIEKVIPTWLARLIGGLLRRKVFKYSDRTTLEVLKELTSNEKLLGVLTAQYGDYGLLPSESSFYMHALLANHYMEGGAYPVGGSSSIAETVIPVIEAGGGAVLSSAAVVGILVENDKAVGVEMADGKKIYADTVISNAGVLNTFSSLLPESVAKKHNFEEKLEHLKPSAAHIGLYIGIMDTPENLDLPRCNYWVFPDEYDHKAVRESYAHIDDDIPVAYVSFPGAKDIDSQKRYPGRTTVEAIIIVPYEWFTKWEDKEWKQRGDEYDAMKERVAQQILELVYRVAPQLKDKIDYYEVSTPLSTTHFTGHKHGEMYGLTHTPERFRQRILKPHTPVKNLYLTGQDVMIASISGGLMGGVLCASAILQKDVLKTINRSFK